MPSGLAVGRDGTVFIADTANNRIRSVTPDGMLHTVAGNGPVGLNQSIFSGDDRLAVNVHLNLPEDVVRDSVGNLYVADTDNERIRRIDPDGHITTLLAADSGYFAGIPTPLGYVRGLGIDAQGNVYVADSGNHRIYKLWLEDRCEGRAWYRAEDGHLHLPLIKINAPWGISLFAVQADLYHLGYTRQGGAAFGIGNVDFVEPQATPEVPPCHAVYQVLDGTLHVPRLDIAPDAPKPVLPVLDDVGHHSSVVTTDLRFKHGLFVVERVQSVE
jgi:sugar lactone lactonase YvrE